MFQNLHDLFFTLVLDLVYNPLGAFLPPDESQLEAKYKEELKEAFGIEFNSLYTMTNMPIKRFADFLRRRNEMKPYLDLLVRNFNYDTVDELMCRNLLRYSFSFIFLRAIFTKKNPCLPKSLPGKFDIMNFQQKVICYLLTCILDCCLHLIGL